jgi:HK97 family phage prohead protease
VPEILRRTFQVADLHVRTADDEADPAAGRIIDLRVVPYGVTAEVRDRPDAEPYLEQFARGAFSRAVRAPARVELRYHHGQGLADWIGRGLQFSETDDGLEGSVRVLGGPFGDHALQLVDEGMLAGVSVGFRDLARRNRRSSDGAIIRAMCHLEEVSLTRSPAYQGALVTGRRSSTPPADLPELPERDAELDARLRAVGITLGG